MSESYTPSVEEVVNWIPATHRDLARRMIAQVRREAAVESTTHRGAELVCARYARETTDQWRGVAHPACCCSADRRTRMSEQDELMANRLSSWVGALTDGITDEDAARLGDFLLDVKHRLLTVTRDMSTEPLTTEHTPDIPELRAAFLTVAELNGHTGPEWEAAFNRALQRIRNDAIQDARHAEHSMTGSTSPTSHRL